METECSELLFEHASNDVAFGGRSSFSQTTRGKCYYLPNSSHRSLAILPGWYLPTVLDQIICSSKKMRMVLSELKSIHWSRSLAKFEESLRSSIR